MQFLTQPDVVGSWTLAEENRALCSGKGQENGAGVDDSVYFGNFPAYLRSERQVS